MGIFDDLWNFRLDVALFGICEKFKMNSGEIGCEVESWVELVGDCSALYDGLWH